MIWHENRGIVKDCEHLRHKDFSYNKTRKIREKRKSQDILDRETYLCSSEGRINGL